MLRILNNIQESEGIGKFIRIKDNRFENTFEII